MSGNVQAKGMRPYAAYGRLMTYEQRRVLLDLDALRIYWVGFEGRAVRRRGIVADADLAARLHADRGHSIDICWIKKLTRSTATVIPFRRGGGAARGPQDRPEISRSGPLRWPKVSVALIRSSGAPSASSNVRRFPSRWRPSARRRRDEREPCVCLTSARRRRRGRHHHADAGRARCGHACRG